MKPSAVDIGSKVTIRVIDAEGDTRDLVGELVSQTMVKRRDGSEVEFNPAAISHWRVIHVTSTKAGTGAPLSVRVREIEAAAACTWPAEVSVTSGDWLLRASGGVTRRANSALPLGIPPYGGRDDSTIEQAVAEVVEFARAHGIRPAVQVALPTYALLDEHLAEAGWHLASDHHVLVHDARSLALSESSSWRLRWTVRHEDQPSDAWHLVRGPDPAATIMSRWPSNYLSIWADGVPVGVGRLAISDGWGVLTRVFVNRAYRCRGVGVAIMEALAQAALVSGTERLAVQVSAENRAALRLYDRLGFRHHHRYRHRVHGAFFPHQTHGG